MGNSQRFRLRKRLRIRLWTTSNQSLAGGVRVLQVSAPIELDQSTYRSHLLMLHLRTFTSASRSRAAITFAPLPPCTPAAILSDRATPIVTIGFGGHLASHGKQVQSHFLRTSASVAEPASILLGRHVLWMPCCILRFGGKHCDDKPPPIHTLKWDIQPARPAPSCWPLPTPPGVVDAPESCPPLPSLSLWARGATPRWKDRGSTGPLGGLLAASGGLWGAPGGPLGGLLG